MSWKKRYDENTGTVKIAPALKASGNFFNSGKAFLDTAQ